MIREVDSSVKKQLRKHNRKWLHCTLCSLQEHRNVVVLWRGQIPCDVLFIGEAPGESEDVIGVPFCGPAGRLLDEIIEAAIEDVLKVKSKHMMQGKPIISTHGRYTWRYAITNVVACKPVDTSNPESAGMIRKPTTKECKACQPRLEQFVEMAQPRLIVGLGLIAAKYLPKLDCQFIKVVHPAALLRMNAAQYSLGFKRTYKSIAAGMMKL